MTLRTRLLVIGAIRGADGRQQILRLGLRGHWRQRFAALLQRIAALAVSSVAQYQPPKKSSAQALQTASVPLPTKLTSSVQMMFLGSAEDRAGEPLETHRSMFSQAPFMWSLSRWNGQLNSHGFHLVNCFRRRLAAIRFSAGAPITFRKRCRKEDALTWWIDTETSTSGKSR